MQFQSYEKPFTLYDLVAAVFRYKGRFAFATMVTLVLSIVGIFLFPRRYDSEAKLMVKLSRDYAALDPTTIGQTISIQESRESEINSIVDLLTSRGLAEKIVDKIGVDEVLKKHAWIEVQLEQALDYASGLAEQLSSSGSGDGEISAKEIADLKRREDAIKHVNKNLRISSTKRSTNITIQYRATSPQLANKIVKQAIESYRTMQAVAHQSDGTVQFFNKQFSNHDTLLKDVEDQLRNKKSSNKIVTMTGKQESLQSEITNVEQMKLNSVADLEAAKARVAKLNASLESLPAELMAEKSSGNPQQATDFMRDRFYQLEIREKELSSKYVSTHPELKRVREQLEEARQIMSQQPKDREESKLAINPVRIDIQNELLLADSEVRSLEARVESLDGLHDKLVSQLNDVNEIELVAEDLQRKIDVGRENYRIYARKLEESRINAALDQESLSNLAEFAAPSMEFKPASPKRSLLAGVAVLLSLCCGFANALLADYKARSKELEEIRLAEREHYLLTLRQQSAEAAARIESKRTERLAALPTKSRGAAESEAIAEKSLQEQVDDDQVDDDLPDDGESTKVGKAK